MRMCRNVCASKLKSSLLQGFHRNENRTETKPFRSFQGKSYNSRSEYVSIRRHKNNSMEEQWKKHIDIYGSIGWIFWLHFFPTQKFERSRGERKEQEMEWNRKRIREDWINSWVDENSQGRSLEYDSESWIIVIFDDTAIDTKIIFHTFQTLLPFFVTSAACKALWKCLLMVAFECWVGIDRQILKFNKDSQFSFVATRHAYQMYSLLADFVNWGCHTHSTEVSFWF